MSTQVLNAGFSSGTFTGWSGNATSFGSGFRNSFPCADPTFPSSSTITQVALSFNVSNIGDVDANTGLCAGGIVLTGIGQITLAGTSIHDVDNGGYVNQVVSRPTGGSFSYADLALLEVLVQTAGGSSNTCVYNSGSFTITFTLPAPSATTSAASNVTTSGATLNGTINPNGGTAAYPTSYFFQYGFTAAYGSVTATTGGQTGSSPIIVGVPVLGLVGSSTYHFRLVATNGDNTVFGADQTFTTSPGDTVVIHL